ncbi:hypothetical protein N0V93_010366 [Gnomoniopsis smithogilvyi]|uniref:Uncharacterized protein n=1 Tax=Gnomoniopsis smithogilvyi TaxID=1191159 RepID=A0A9W9CRV1_9PEZI|nr:hypothetical protein N0V93_010366 [Gnomoniopsis smithogilvyi]
MKYKDVKLESQGEDANGSPPAKRMKTMALLQPKQAPRGQIISSVLFYEFGSEAALRKAARSTKVSLKQLNTLVCLLLDHLGPPCMQAGAYKTAISAPNGNSKGKGKVKPKPKPIASGDNIDPGLHLICLFFGVGPIQSVTILKRLLQYIDNIGVGKAFASLEELYLRICEKQPDKTNIPCVPSRWLFCLGPSRRLKYCFVITPKSLADLVLDLPKSQEKDETEVEKEDIDDDGDEAAKAQMERPDKHAENAADREETQVLEVAGNTTKHKTYPGLACHASQADVNDKPASSARTQDIVPRSFKDDKSGSPYFSLSGKANELQQHLRPNSRPHEDEDEIEEARGLDSEKTGTNENLDCGANSLLNKIGLLARALTVPVSATNGMLRDEAHGDISRIGGSEIMVDGVLEDDESTTFHIAPIEFVDVGLGGHQDFQGPQPQSGPSTSPQGIHTRQDPPLSEADFDKLEDVTGWVNDEAMNHLAKSFDLSTNAPLPEDQFISTPPSAEGWAACMEYHTSALRSIRRAIAEKLTTRRTRHDVLVTQLSQAAALLRELDQLGFTEQGRISSLCEQLCQGTAALGSAVELVGTLRCYMDGPERDEMTAPLQGQISALQRRQAFWMARLVRLDSFAKALEIIRTELDQDMSRLEEVGVWLARDEEQFAAFKYNDVST